MWPARPFSLGQICYIIFIFQDSFVYLEFRPLSNSTISWNSLLWLFLASLTLLASEAQLGRTASHSQSCLLLDWRPVGSRIGLWIAEGLSLSSVSLTQFLLRILLKLGVPQGSALVALSSLFTAFMGNLSHFPASQLTLIFT